MRVKVFLVLVLAVVVAPAAFADVILTFSAPVNFVSFYSSEPNAMPLTVTAYGNSITTVTVASGQGVGVVTPFAASGVTELDFAGTPNFYVLDDLTYMVGGNTYMLTFDEAALQSFIPVTVGSFYSAMAGGPTFGLNGQTLHYPNYNYTDFPFHSGPDVLYEGYYLPPPPPPQPPIPEPGTLVLFGSGLISAAGVIRRKLKA